MKLEHVWPHVSTCTEADVLRGASPGDVTVSLAGFVCEANLVRRAGCE